MTLKLVIKNKSTLFFFSLIKKVLRVITIQLNIYYLLKKS